MLWLFVFQPQDLNPPPHIGVSQAVWTWTTLRPIAKCNHPPPPNQCQMVVFPYVVHTLAIMRWLQYLVCRCISAQVDSVDWKQFARGLALARCLPLLLNLGGLQEIKRQYCIGPLIIAQRHGGCYRQTKCSPLLLVKECKPRDRQWVKCITSVAMYYNV